MYKCKHCKSTYFRANVYQSVNVEIDEDGFILETGYNFSDPDVDEDSIYCGDCGEDIEKIVRMKETEESRLWACKDGKCDGEEYRDYETLAEVGNPYCPKCDGDMELAG